MLRRIAPERHRDLADGDKLIGGKVRIGLYRSCRPVDLEVCCGGAAQPEVQPRIVRGEVTGLAVALLRLNVATVQAKLDPVVSSRSIIAQAEENASDTTQQVSSRNINLRITQCIACRGDQAHGEDTRAKHPGRAPVQRTRECDATLWMSVPASAGAHR